MSQILERNVADLEARIRELTEGPSPDTITLHNPHGSGSSTHSRGATAVTAATATGHNQPPYTTYLPSPTSPDL